MFLNLGETIEYCDWSPVPGRDALYLCFPQVFDYKQEFHGLWNKMLLTHPPVKDMLMYLPIMGSDDDNFKTIGFGEGDMTIAISSKSFSSNQRC